MGGIAKCCCTCDCLPIEDLPEITISGYTGQGWTGTCCYEQVFTPNTSSWSKSCTADVLNSTLIETCETDHYRLLTPLYKGYEVIDIPNVWPCTDKMPPPDYCCPEGNEKIATTNTTWRKKNRAFYGIWEKNSKIIVRVSREQVNCEDVPGQSSGCKIVIRTKYIYDVRIKGIGQNKAWSSQTVAMHNTSCFAADPDFIWTESEPADTTCTDLPDDPGPYSPGLISNFCDNLIEVAFDRVKYYDTMPTGNVQFTNTAIPGCTAEGCQYAPYNFTSQTCINTPDVGNQCIYEACYCQVGFESANWSIVEPDYICEGDLIPGSPSFKFASNCFDCQGYGEFDLCTVSEVDCFGTPFEPYTCSGTGHTRYFLGFTTNRPTSGPCNNYVIGDNSSGNIRENSGVPFGKYGACGAGFGIDGVGGYKEPFDRTSLCVSPGCDGDCCVPISGEDCPCCFPDGQCFPKHWTKYWATGISHEITRTCSGITSQQYCISAPTWTINLA